MLYIWSQHSPFQNPFVYKGLVSKFCWTCAGIYGLFPGIHTKTAREALPHLHQGTTSQRELIKLNCFFQISTVATSQRTVLYSQSHCYAFTFQSILTSCINFTVCTFCPLQSSVLHYIMKSASWLRAMQRCSYSKALQTVLSWKLWTLRGWNVAGGGQDPKRPHGGWFWPSLTQPWSLVGECTDRSDVNNIHGRENHGVWFTGARSK